MSNFARELADAAAEHPEQPAITLDDLVLNYQLLDEATARMAGLLRARGIGAGDRVGMQLPNVPYFPAVYLGALRLGAVVVPMNPLLKDREVAYHLSDSGAKLVFGWHQFADACAGGAEQAGTESVLVKPGEFEQLLASAEPWRELAEREDSDPAVIVYTSGTTGTPKGAMLTHGNLSAAARVGCELIGAGPQTVTVATLPLFHVFGMSAIMNVTLHAHGLLTLVPRFEPGKVLEVIERDRATTFGGVPTMFAALLHHPERERHDVSSINLCVSGGAPMPVEVLRGFDEAFGATVLEGYGLTETTGMGTFTPREIEEVLYEHPAVREAAVLGVPHSSLGEEVGAAVSLKQGSSEVKPEELRDWLKQRVAAYKYPRLVWIVDELPKGPTGKILKREIELPETAKAR